MGNIPTWIIALFVYTIGGGLMLLILMYGP